MPIKRFFERWLSASTEGEEILLTGGRAKAALYRQAKVKSLRHLRDDLKPVIAGQNRFFRSRSRKFIDGPAERLTAFRRLPVSVRRRLLLMKRSRSLLLDALLPERTSIWMPISQRLRSPQQSVIEVSNFSFLTNPKEVMRSLRSIAVAEARSITAQIDFLDEDCLDIGPWLLLAVLRRDMSEIFSGGMIGSKLSAVISALGLDSALRIDLPTRALQPTAIWAFPIRSRRPAGTSRSPTLQLDPQRKEAVAGELCDAINTWLQRTTFELSFEGRRTVSKIVGETLDNAERYSRPEFPNDGDWSISGYMKRSEGGDQAVFICQLAFLSVGASIAETVIGCNAATRREMDAYVDLHSPAMSNHQRADLHLRTIFALQDTVSGNPSAIAAGRGGTGFSDIITLFGGLSRVASDKTRARLAVVSGRTCLHIDAARSHACTPLPGQRFNIWFNPENLKDLPPEGASVVELDHHFAGTLITMAFELDDGYLKNARDENDRSRRTDEEKGPDADGASAGS